MMCPTSLVVVAKITWILQLSRSVTGNALARRFKAFAGRPQWAFLPGLHRARFD